jgi:hypothetical protein
MWLQDPVSACRGVLMDPACREYFTTFVEGNCGSVVQMHVQFFEQAMAIRMAQGSLQIKKMRLTHMKKFKNPVFYCTTTEIDYGNLNTTNWGPIFEQMCLWQEQSTFMLASEAFLRFLEHASSIEVSMMKLLIS